MMEYKALPKVVVIGGGTGLPVLLRGLKRFPVNITAIVTVADDGGSSGRIREDLRVPPPGDIRNVLAALSEVEPLILQLFQHRFRSDGELSGHSLGNLMLAAMTNITGNFARAVQEMSKVLNVKGTVLPSSNQIVMLHAELEDGTIISGESKIPLAGKRIKRVFLTPDRIDPLPEAVRSIETADFIIVGPGSLYTSILPNLLVPGIGHAVRQAKARKIYICNLMTQPGETDGYKASDHIRAIFDHIGHASIHQIIVNDGAIPEEITEKYKKEMSVPVLPDVDNLVRMGLDVISEPIADYKSGIVRHNSLKLSEIIFQIIKETL
nr:YvcK family protein [Caldibacillus debilis]